MASKIILTSTSFDSYVRGIRRRFSKATRREIYREWCKEFEREGSIDYVKSAARIKKRQERKATP